MGELRQIAVDVDVHRVIENARRNFNESENDILKRLLFPDRTKANRSLIRISRTGRRSPTVGAVKRARGLWSVEIRGQRISAANMKDAYRLLLLKIEELAPGFLDR